MVPVAPDAGFGVVLAIEMAVALPLALSTNTIVVFDPLSIPLTWVLFATAAGAPVVLAFAASGAGVLFGTVALAGAAKG